MFFFFFNVSLVVLSFLFLNVRFVAFSSFLFSRDSWRCVYSFVFVVYVFSKSKQTCFWGWDSRSHPAVVTGFTRVFTRSHGQLSAESPEVAVNKCFHPFFHLFIRRGASLGLWCTQLHGFCHKFVPLTSILPEKVRT